MAELLVVLESSSHPDPEKDRRGSWKRGMVVVVKPDGWPWGRKEGPPKFGIVQVPGNVEDFADLTETKPDPIIPEITHRRARQLNLAQLATNLRRNLEEGGRANLGRQQLDNLKEER